MEAKDYSDQIKGMVIDGIFTHHQKSVIVDAEGTEDQRRLVAYVGGLDLTTGRYDTPNHDLFETLLDEHANDF